MYQVLLLLVYAFINKTNNRPTERFLTFRDSQGREGLPSKYRTENNTKGIWRNEYLAEYDLQYLVY